MDNEELVHKLIDAWNRRAVADILSLMDPQGFYHDAFWDETCSGRDLVRYLDTQFVHEKLWYELEGDVIDAPNGVVFRYAAYDRQHPRKRKLMYKGAEVLTIENGVIRGISDFYCDPDPVQLIEVAARIERRRLDSKIAPLGLSDRISGFIRRRLKELADSTTFFLDPDLTPRLLADRVGCTAAHLAHVLEEEEGTTFRDYVNTRRLEFAASLLAGLPADACGAEQLAGQSGFAEVAEFEALFETRFGVGIAEFRARAEGSAEATGTDLLSQSGCYRT